MKAWYAEKPDPYKISVNGKTEVAVRKDWCFIVDGTEFWVPANIYSIDGASIPFIFRWIPGIGKPFDAINLDGAFAHDPLFLTHALGFSKSNEIARQLWIQGGKKESASRAMWLAISSPFGRIAYSNNKADKEMLAITRTMLRWRKDKEKFDTLWFAKEID